VACNDVTGQVMRKRREVSRSVAASLTKRSGEAVLEIPDPRRQTRQILSYTYFTVVNYQCNHHVSSMLIPFTGIDCFIASTNTLKRDKI
jgi:hypothetical protein